MGRHRLHRDDPPKEDAFKLRLKEGYRSRIEALAMKMRVSPTEAIHRAIDAIEDISGLNSKDPERRLGFEGLIENYEIHNFSEEFRHATVLKIYARNLETLLNLHDHFQELTSRFRDSNKVTEFLYCAMEYQEGDEWLRSPIPEHRKPVELLTHLATFPANSNRGGLFIGGLTPHFPKHDFILIVDERAIFSINDGPIFTDRLGALSRLAMIWADKTPDRENPYSRVLQEFEYYRELAIDRIAV